MRKTMLRLKTMSQLIILRTLVNFVSKIGVRMQPTTTPVTKLKVWYGENKYKSMDGSVKASQKNKMDTI
jgi:hypothetical protein